MRDEAAHVAVIHVIKVHHKPKFAGGRPEAETIKRGDATDPHLRFLHIPPVNNAKTRVHLVERCHNRHQHLEQVRNGNDSCGHWVFEQVVREGNVVVCSCVLLLRQASPRVASTGAQDEALNHEILAHWRPTGETQVCTSRPVSAQLHLHGWLCVDTVANAFEPAVDPAQRVPPQVVRSSLVEVHTQQPEYFRRAMRTLVHVEFSRPFQALPGLQLDIGVEEVVLMLV
mmetsp:Transcript_26044/g.60697  ORF Transcript_26044/g.60697 Transcript_26044/m.60697 type:complete len:228 (+) Transcript_26044:417-1100(+)